MKKTRNIGISLGILVLVSFLAILFGVPIINNITAANVKNELLALPLPDNTELIDSVSKAGKLVGNGNGMQYFGAILIKTELSEKELATYYQQFAINEWNCIVERQTTKQIEMIENDTVSFNIAPDYDQYYIIYSWGESNFFLRDLDLRGH